MMVLAQIFRAEARFSMTGKFISALVCIVHGGTDFCPQGDNLMQSGGSNRRMPEVRRFTYNDKSCLLSARKRERERRASQMIGI